MILMTISMTTLFIFSKRVIFLNTFNINKYKLFFLLYSNDFFIKYILHDFIRDINYFLLFYNIYQLNINNICLNTHSY